MVHLSKGTQILGGCFLFFLLLAGVGQAIPSLQLYIPGSTYDSLTETWVTHDSDFELQVLGATSPDSAEYIKDVKLYVAINESENGLAGAFVKINGSAISFDIYGEPFTAGHGIYPTYYNAYSLPDLMVSTAGKTVNNYNPGESGSDTGDIQYLQIEYGGYSSIRFDASGTVVDSCGKTWERTAPFSHDAEASASNPNAVPEPTTMLLLGTGLLGILRLRKRNIAL
ncbi:choice-of-anchor N protein [Candidatus Desantisbacteria bacterium]|nr:choice-of-anchor N protein [Candidatus Desantisbacteria bacterium]